MEFNYGKAPVYYINGVPGYKAGEWPGLKSCKFGNTRRIIQPKCQGIIFNENEPYSPPKRRIYNPGPSPEYVFKPSCKLVDINQFDRRPKVHSLKVREQVFIQNKLDYQYERKHKFDYLIDRENKQKEMEKTMKLSGYVKNELKLMTMVGFKNNNNSLNNLTNSEIKSLKFRRRGDKLTLDMDEEKPDLRQRNAQKLADRNYVKNLGEWENKTLAKTEIKPEAAPLSTNPILSNIETTAVEEKKDDKKAK